MARREPAGGQRGGRGGEQRFDDPFGREWSRKLYDGGYAGLTWPTEYGGAGAPYSFQAIFYEEMARAQAPAHVGVIGLGMAGPTIMAHGTEKQKQAHLSKILSAEEIWCQGFSEPDAGSDLAAVRTRAERGRRVYVVNGQKVWSSFAHIADFCILITQSDPEAPRYRNLTYLIVDMHAPGVEVRPLRQITGEAEFNEIFFTDVEVPVENRLARRGRGLAGRDDDAAARARHARVRAHGGARGRRRPAARRSARSASTATPVAATRVAPEWIELQALRYTNYRVARHVPAHRHPRPGGLGDQAALVGAEPAHDEARPRAARRRTASSTTAGGTTSSSAAAATRSRPARRRSSATSSPSACSASRRCALMDFALTEEQQELKQRGARVALPSAIPLDRDWEQQDDRWSELAELGWLGVAEAGLGFVEEALLLEEMGYACYPGFYLGHVASVPGDGEVATVDPTRRFDRVEETPRFRAAAAAEAVGIAQRVLELGVEHASTREQFGKPIGVYQAVSHQLANTYTDVELARSLVYWAAWCVAEDDEQAPLAAAAAKAFAAEAAVPACERSIQVHGGTGFTWEHPLHRFYKRALWLEGFGARPTELRLEIASALLA